jgi:hypothetical protein
VDQSCEIRASRAEFNLYDYEEALEVGPMVGKLIQLAPTAAMGSHTYVLEDPVKLIQELVQRIRDFQMSELEPYLIQLALLENDFATLQAHP